MTRPAPAAADGDDQTGRMVTQPNGRVRPLSPHLQIWRWHVTMLASILHRISGSALAVGAVLVAAWLGALAMGPEAYQTFSDLSGSVVGVIVWIGISAALFYHLASGVRHLIWDTGAGLSPKAASTLSALTIAFAFGATAVFWALLFATGRVAL